MSTISASTPLRPMTPVRALPAAAAPTAAPTDSFASEAFTLGHKPPIAARAQAAPAADVHKKAARGVSDTPMAQAKEVVAQAHALISQIGGGNAPIGTAQATQLVAVIDSTGAMLQSIAKSSGGDPMVLKYVQDTLKDLGTARDAYVALGADITKDNQTDTQIIQATNAQVQQSTQQGLQQQEKDQGGAIGDVTIGLDEPKDS